MDAQEQSAQVPGEDRNVEIQGSSFAQTFGHASILLSNMETDPMNGRADLTIDLGLAVETSAEADMATGIQREGEGRREKESAHPRLAGAEMKVDGKSDEADTSLLEKADPVKELDFMEVGPLTDPAKDPEDPVKELDDMEVCPLSDPAKDPEDTKVKELDDMKVGPLADPVKDLADMEVGSLTGPVKDHEDMELCSQTKPLKDLENMEISLAVEITTNAEWPKGCSTEVKESSQEEPGTSVEQGRHACTETQAELQEGALLSDKGHAKVEVHEDMEIGITENVVGEGMGEERKPDQPIQQDAHVATEMQVETEIHTLPLEKDGVKADIEGRSAEEIYDKSKGGKTGEERHGQAWHADIEKKIRENAGTLLFEKEGVDADPVSHLDMAGGSLEEEEARMGEEKREKELGKPGEQVQNASTDMQVEIEAGTVLFENRGATQNFAEDHQHMDGVLAEVLDGERKGEERKEEESSRPAEQAQIAGSKIQAEALLFVKGGDKTDSVEGCHDIGDGIAEEMEDKRRVQEPVYHTSIELQVELGEDRTLLEKERAQADFLQDLEGMDEERKGKERGEENFGSMETIEEEKEKEDRRQEEPSQLNELDQDACTGMQVEFEERDVNADPPNSHQHMGRGLAEETEERREETLCEAEAGSLLVKKGAVKEGSGACYQDMDRDSGEEMEEEKERRQEVPSRLHEMKPGTEIQAKKEVDTLLLAGSVECHHDIKQDSAKEMIKEANLVKGEGVGGREEEAQLLSGQDLQAAPAIQGLVKIPWSENGAVKDDSMEGEGRMLERQPNCQAHTEMWVRVQVGKSLLEKEVKADLIISHEAMELDSGMRMHKELPLAKSKKAKEEELGGSSGERLCVDIAMQVKAKADVAASAEEEGVRAGSMEGYKETMMEEVGLEEDQEWAFQGTGDENDTPGISRAERAGVSEEEKTGMSDEANTGTSEEEKYARVGLEQGGTTVKVSQKRKLSVSLASDSGITNGHGQADAVVKKAKKKAVNVWAKTSSRKGGKRNSKNGVQQNPGKEDSVLITPVYVNQDKLEDGPDQPIALSKYDKAEKIELSENRLSASSTKGYRMVRATRGVLEGTWYFEILVEQLGPTGHTRLGWSTQKGDVQAPVGFDNNSYGYRDVDGSKTHVAVREPYGDSYLEGDVIGFYIHLPHGADYAPKQAPLVSYRGRPYLSDTKEEHPKKVPESEICFFRNGVCQGTAFKDINAGRYFPAASMYTLPKEPSCTVKFNFGPEFQYPPIDIGERPVPRAMFLAPYHNGLGGNEPGSVAWGSDSHAVNATQNNEPQRFGEPEQV